MKQQIPSSSLRSRVRIFLAAATIQLPKTRHGVLRYLNIPSFRRYGAAISKGLEAAARPSIRQRPPTYSSSSERMPPTSASASPKPRGNVFAYLFLAATIICVITILVLLKQLGDVKASIAKWQHQMAATNAKIIQAQSELRRLSNSKIVQPEIKPRRSVIALGQRDIDLIRQFIKVPPHRVGKATIQLGGRVPNAVSIPLPESLTSKIPALQGASFLLDKDGSIVLIGKGSDQVDAIIPTQF
jgi:hypothetical protein